MVQQLQQSKTDIYFIVILLLLSYVMSSAPRYLREMKVPQQKAPKESPSFMEQVIRMGKAYTITPYQKVWQNLQPKVEIAALWP